MGDSFGSYASANGDLGNPGVFIPGPGAMVLMAMGGLAAARRHR